MTGLRTTLPSPLASLDLGPCDSREHMVEKLRERRNGLIADLIALAETRLALTPENRARMEAARRKELALCEEILSGMGEEIS